MKRVLVYGMTHNPGGIEAYLINLAKRVKESVIFDYVTDFEQIAHLEFIQSMDSKVYYIPPKGKQVFAHLMAFFHILKQHPEYDTVYFNILDAGAAITESIPWILGRRVVTHSHNSSTEKIRLHKLCKPLLNLFTKEYVACSQIAAEYMFGKRKKALIIPNAIETKKFIFDSKIREAKRKELLLDDKLVVCHVGRLSLQKNPIRMLDIFKEVLKIKENAILLSVGSGEMEEEVHAYARKIDVDKNVLFLGRRMDIPEILQAADVFILPSLYEGLGIVVLEAQASGLNCVVSSEVPRDVNVTGKVAFVPLDESNHTWADVLLNATNEVERENTYSAIVSGGYDIDNCKKKDLELLKMLNV